MEIFRITFLAGILICLIYFLRLWAKDKLSRGVFSILWKIALIRLLLPISIPVDINLHRFFEWAEQDNLPVTVSSLPLTAFTYVQKNSLTEVPVTTGFTFNPIITGWLAGAILFLCAFLISFIKSRKQIGEALPVKNQFIEEWKRSRLIIRPVNVMVHDRITTPVTVGILKPMIILPKTMDLKNEKTLEYVLTHELVHIKSFDALWKFLAVTGMCIHWFNPFVWLMYNTFERDMEVACDEKVITMLGENVKKEYALTLIELAEKKSGFSLLYNYFGKKPIEERIVALMKRKRTSFAGASLSVLLIIFSAFVFITEADATSDEPVSTAEDTVISGFDQNTVEHTKNTESRLYYPVNENGYTYGANIYDTEPDLIAATSVEGVVGYVYSDDLEGEQPNNPEEAVQYMKNQPDYRIIPVYEKDGETIIGTFKISGSVR